MTPHNSRRKAREMALQALFQHNFHSDLDPKESVSYLAEKVGADSETHGFAHTLVAGVLEHKDEIDQLIQSKAQHWSLERMALVDLCLLRLAAFELTHLQEEIPPQVAINEAVEIAKEYSNADSSAFVNGILDQIKK